MQNTNKLWDLRYTRQKHPFHLVNRSPWPFFGSMAAISLTIGAVLYMHRYSNGGSLLFWGAIFLVTVILFWFRDVILEATYEGHHTKKVQYGLRFGMKLFILSEVMFFFAFFWAFFHAALSPHTFLGVMWPPRGIIPMYIDGWIPETNSQIARDSYENFITHILNLKVSQKIYKVDDVLVQITKNNEDFLSKITKQDHLSYNPRLVETVEGNISQLLASKKRQIFLLSIINDMFGTILDENFKKTPGKNTPILNILVEMIQKNIASLKLEKSQVKILNSWSQDLTKDIAGKGILIASTKKSMFLLDTINNLCAMLLDENIDRIKAQEKYSVALTTEEIKNFIMKKNIAWSIMDKPYWVKISGCASKTDDGHRYAFCYLPLFNPYSIPLAATFILLSSGVTLHTAGLWFKFAGIESNWPINNTLRVLVSKLPFFSIITNSRTAAYNWVTFWLAVTIALGLIFTCIQSYEYFVLLPFGINDSVFGSCFYLLTGFHGFHVILGTLALIICLIRHLKMHFTSTIHIGFECAAWYWHFVDGVWLFVYSILYWWSAPLKQPYLWFNETDETGAPIFFSCGENPWTWNKMLEEKIIFWPRR